MRFCYLKKKSKSGEGNKAHRFCNPPPWVVNCWPAVFVSISVIQWLQATFLELHMQLFILLLHASPLHTRALPTLHTFLSGNIVLNTGHTWRNFHIINRHLSLWCVSWFKKTKKQNLAVNEIYPTMNSEVFTVCILPAVLERTYSWVWICMFCLRGGDSTR